MSDCKAATIPGDGLTFPEPVGVDSSQKISSHREVRYRANHAHSYNAVCRDLFRAGIIMSESTAAIETVTYTCKKCQLLGRGGCEDEQTKW